MINMAVGQPASANSAPSKLARRAGMVYASHLNGFHMHQHIQPIRVRYDECDPMGFVHHSHYLKYFEIARTEMYRASGGNYRDFEASGLFVVVVRVECQYRLPARYDDLLSIRASIQRMTEAKIIHDYSVERDAQQLVTAQVTLAVIDRTGKPQRIPESLRSSKD